MECAYHTREQRQLCKVVATPSFHGRFTNLAGQRGARGVCKRGKAKMGDALPSPKHNNHFGIGCHLQRLPCPANQWVEGCIAARWVARQAQLSSHVKHAQPHTPIDLMGSCWRQELVQVIHLIALKLHAFWLFGFHR